MGFRNTKDFINVFIFLNKAVLFSFVFLSFVLIFTFRWRILILFIILKYFFLYFFAKFEYRTPIDSILLFAILRFLRMIRQSNIFSSLFIFLLNLEIDLTLMNLFDIFLLVFSAWNKRSSFWGYLSFIFILFVIGKGLYFFIFRYSIIICWILKWLQANIVRSSFFRTENSCLVISNRDYIQILITVFCKRDIYSSWESFVDQT